MKQPIIEILSEKGESLVRFIPQALLNFAAIQGVSAAAVPGCYTLRVTFPLASSRHFVSGRLGHGVTEAALEWPFVIEPDLEHHPDCDILKNRGLPCDCREPDEEEE